MRAALPVPSEVLISLPCLSPLPLSLLEVGQSPLVQVVALEMVVGPGPVAVRLAYLVLVPLAALGFLQNLSSTINLALLYRTITIFVVPGADGLKRGAPDGHVGAVPVPGGLSVVGLRPEGREGISEQRKICLPGAMGLNS